MLDFDAWLSENSAIDPASRAVDAWRRIQDKPSEVVLVRGDAALPAQTVRVEYSTTSSGAPQVTDGAGTSGRINAIIFGVKGHPTIPDTDIQRNDLFAYQGHQFEVKVVIESLGELQAITQVLS